VPKIHNVQLALEQARSGKLTVTEMKKQIKTMHERGSPVALDAAAELGAIVQRHEGEKAVAAAALEDASPGSAKWAFA
jgi:hypothetical protein